MIFHKPRTAAHSALCLILLLGLGEDCDFTLESCFFEIFFYWEDYECPYRLFSDGKTYQTEYMWNLIAAGWRLRNITGTEENYLLGYLCWFSSDISVRGQTEYSLLLLLLHLWGVNKWRHGQQDVLEVNNDDMASVLTETAILAWTNQLLQYSETVITLMVLFMRWRKSKLWRLPYPRVMHALFIAY